MAGISGRTGYVTLGVSPSAICAYNWTYNSELSDPDGNRIETTTFCSSAREYIVEDVPAEIVVTIDYNYYQSPSIDLLGASNTVTVGNADCEYSIEDAICTTISCRVPIEGPMEGSVTWSKTESA